MRIFGRPWNPFGSAVALAIGLGVVAVISAGVMSSGPNTHVGHVAFWTMCVAGTVDLLLWMFLAGFID